jgi:hypothetical protein
MRARVRHNGPHGAVVVVQSGNEWELRAELGPGFRFGNSEYGLVAATTENEILDSSVCPREALSGTTTLTSPRISSSRQGVDIPTLFLSSAACWLAHSVRVVGAVLTPAHVLRGKQAPTSFTSTSFPAASHGAPKRGMPFTLVSRYSFWPQSISIT